VFLGVVFLGVVFLAVALAKLMAGCFAAKLILTL
jgi:hypothetical protein